MANPFIDSFTGFLNSPTGALAIGGMLFYGIQKFFKEVEEKLNDDTKTKISLWLLNADLPNDTEEWPETFAAIFRRVFTDDHLSWRCFYRSAIASTICGLAGLLLTMHRWVGSSLSDTIASVETAFLPTTIIEAADRLVVSIPNHLVETILRSIVITLLALFLVLLTNVMPDFVSLYETRVFLKGMHRWPYRLTVSGMLVLNFISTSLTATFWNIGLIKFLYGSPSGWNEWRELFKNLLVVSPTEPNWKGWLIYPALFTSVWLWLYALSGVFLKGLQRLSFGLNWFKRVFNIKDKPLQSIGLVSGILATLAYWAILGVGKL